MLRGWAPTVVCFLSLLRTPPAVLGDAEAGKGIHEVGAFNSADLDVDGQARMDWQELVIMDDISMLRARTPCVADKQLYKFRGRSPDLGGIPIVLFRGGRPPILPCSGEVDPPP